MKEPLFLGTSDWHLERNAWVRHPELCGDSYYALKQIVDFCHLYEVDLLAAGDLFDKPFPDSRSVWEAMKQLDRMDDRNLDVYYTQGQHERSKDQPWLGLHGLPIYLHNKYQTKSNIQISGLDYTKPSDLDDALQVARGSQIFLCHQVWQDFMGASKHVPTDGKLSQIPMDSGLVLTGDYHKHCQASVVSKATGKPFIALSPGSTCLQSVDEPSDKSVYLIYDDLTFVSLPLKSRQVFHHELSTEQALEDFLATINMGWLEPQEYVPDNIAKPILSIKYNPDIADMYLKIVNGIGQGRAHLFIRPIAREIDHRVVENEATQETIELGLAGNLAKLCSSDSEVYDIAKAMLLSPNPKDELNQIENTYLERR